MTLIQLKPPFVFSYPNPLIAPGIFRLENAYTDRAKIVPGPSVVTIDSERDASKGLFVLGPPGRETWITLGTANDFRLVASNSVGAVATYFLRTHLGILPPELPVTGVCYQDVLIIGGLGRLLKLDLYSLQLDVLSLEPGLESALEPYVDTALLPTLGVCRHGARFVYWFDGPVDVPLTVEPTKAQMAYGDRNRLRAGARMRLWPSDIIYSDPFQPTACKWSSIWSVHGIYGGNVTACASVPEGLLVLTSSGAFLLKGDDIADAVMVTLTEWADCIAPRSVVTCQGVTFWVGRRAVWAYEHGRGVRIVESLTDVLEEHGVHGARRRGIVATSLFGGRYILLFGRGVRPFILELDGGVPGLLEPLNGATVFPIAPSGVGTSDELAIGGHSSLSAMVFDVSQTAMVVFTVPNMSGFVRSLALTFDRPPKQVRAACAILTHQFRTDWARSIPPEEQTLGTAAKEIWPSRTVDDGTYAEYVHVHPLFDRAVFQDAQAPATLVRWLGGYTRLEANAGLRVRPGEVLGVIVQFSGACLLGADIGIAAEGEG